MAKQTPRKRRRKAAPKEPEEPSDFVAYIREKGQKRFATEKNVTRDVDQNVREIRALLAINAEIFDRVMAHASRKIQRRPGKAKFHRGRALYTQSEDSDSDAEAEVVRLTRCGFEHVEVRNRYGESVQFVTEVVSSVKDFNIKDLKHLPTDLEDVCVVKYHTCYIGDCDDEYSFVDYSVFFERALLLHDDVLGPFLVKLKDHLESIHVLLGKMESWLLEVQSQIEFIKSTFDMKLETPTPNDVGEEWELEIFKETGEFGKTFDINSKSDRAKLKKLLEYMES